jgi:hypothetical protein
MIAIMIFAAAASGPVVLASRDETQWRAFVRASLQRPPAPSDSRMRQLEGVVRGLGVERTQTLAGPNGL